MFKPLAYDDTKAVNVIGLPEAVKNDMAGDMGEAAKRLGLPALEVHCEMALERVCVRYEKDIRTSRWRFCYLFQTFHGRIKHRKCQKRDAPMDNDFIQPQHSEIIMYQAEYGLTKIDVQMSDETVWLSLDQMAELFQRDKSTISRHIKNIFGEGIFAQRLCHE